MVANIISIQTMVLTLTPTFLLIELVLSSASLIASLAIIAAQSQSTSIYPHRNFPQWEWIVYCILALSLLLSSIAALFSLARNTKRWLLFVHFFLMIMVTTTFGRLIVLLLLSPHFGDFNWLISIGTLIPIEAFLLIAMMSELRTLNGG